MSAICANRQGEGTGWMALTVVQAAQRPGEPIWMFRSVSVKGQSLEQCDQFPMDIGIFLGQDRQGIDIESSESSVLCTRRDGRLPKLLQQRYCFISALIATGEVRAQEGDITRLKSRGVWWEVLSKEIRVDGGCHCQSSESESASPYNFGAEEVCRLGVTGDRASRSVYEGLCLSAAKSLLLSECK